MKKILIILLITCFIILTIFKVKANVTTFPLVGKTIIIDSGHGGKDAGASANEIKEKDINLAITYKLKKELENVGAVVLLTRTDDADLSKPNATRRKKSDFDIRIALINNSNADMYISVHQNNYSNPKYYGPQVFYSNANSKNEKIAKTIQEDLNRFTNSKRKIKITTNTYMYNKLNIPGILVECGFLSNKKDLTNLTNPKYQKELSAVITQSIIKCFS